MPTNMERARILVHALPYIQQYSGKIVVVKYGGSAMQSGEMCERVMRDVALLTLCGVRVVLVHGGGPEISDTLSSMGMETRFEDGLRVTDAKTAEVVQMVLAGKVNKSLVNVIERIGGKAIGLCGLDGHMLEAKMLGAKYGYVGEVTTVNAQPILDLLNMGYIPVISTIGFDKAGNVYNINADTAAARIAGELKAECMLTLTDTPGILRDKADPATLISVLPVSDVPALQASGVIAGGMIPKVACCVEAIERGVGRVFIIDGRVPHAILIEILTDEGLGTMVTK